MRRAALLGLLAAALAPAPASAADMVWQDAGAGLASRYDLRAASALSDGTVLAAGRDSVAGTPVVVRRVNGTWRRDTLPALGAHGDLVDTALTGYGVWAAGWTAPDADPAHRTPLLLRLGAKGWERVAAPAKMALPRAIPLVGADGAVADAAGQVFAIRAGQLDSDPLAPA